ncbi:uncharacterized protein LOC109722021 [Ananas comosus]|uniref:Uncharacterized protein LOC109722021 n=1 Tax=Ananas comosus TaxID=4615 RepID=A0A6P5GJI3_ANACO|nr:uncharacterized protein LOC109722021 [Ananas comosus]
MAATTLHRPKRPVNGSTAPMLSLSPSLLLLLLLLLSASFFLLLLHHSPSFSSSSSSCSPSFPSKRTNLRSSRSDPKPWSGDLRDAEFSWNSLHFSDSAPPPALLRIAVFSRKWPVASAPGGMERHALTLHSALSARGHRIHVFTSAADDDAGGGSANSTGGGAGGIRLHFLAGPAGQWRCDEAWALYEAEAAAHGAFDAVHSESVAVFHRRARGVPNLAATWHGISLESLHSGIYQDLARAPGEPLSPALNRSLALSVFKVLDEIRFFRSYAHHVAISDAAGDMLRDVYQIPGGRVHVILNGVDEAQFGPDPAAGRAFRAAAGVPEEAAVVLGVSGRLVKDKGHPLLYEAFARLSLRHPGAYLLVAGSGPWAQRYAELGRNAVVVGAVEAGRLRGFYNAVDVFVDPTLRPQGLDLTLMEAMQCGRAVAATRLPSVKGSVVVDDEFGFTFAPNGEALLDALERAVAEGPRRLAERGRACRDYAASMFTATKMALAYERLFLCIKNETYCNYP